MQRTNHVTIIMIGLAVIVLTLSAAAMPLPDVTPLHAQNDPTPTPTTTSKQCALNHVQIFGQPYEYPGAGSGFTYNTEKVEDLGLVVYGPTTDNPKHFLQSVYDEAGAPWDNYNPWTTQMSHEPVAILIVDDFDTHLGVFSTTGNQPATVVKSHGDYVLHVAQQIVAAAYPDLTTPPSPIPLTGGFEYYDYGNKILLVKVNVPKYKIEPVDSTDNMMNKIKDAITALKQEEGISNFVINMSFAVVPCDITVPQNPKPIDWIVHTENNKWKVISVAEGGALAGKLKQGDVITKFDCTAYDPAGLVSYLINLESGGKTNCTETVKETTTKICTPASYTALPTQGDYEEGKRVWCAHDPEQPPTTIWDAGGCYLLSQTDIDNILDGELEAFRITQCISGIFCPQSGEIDPETCQSIPDPENDDLIICEIPGLCACETEAGGCYESPTSPETEYIPAPKCTDEEKGYVVVTKEDGSTKCLPSIAILQAISGDSLAMQRTYEYLNAHGITSPTPQQLLTAYKIVSAQLAEEITQEQSIEPLGVWLRDNLPDLVGEEGKVIIVAAAGNYDTSHPFFPGAWPDVISVSSSMSKPEITYGTITIMNPHTIRWLDSSSGELMAPGGWYEIPCGGTADCTAEYVAGTSFAAPAASALIAVSLSAPWCPGDYANLANGLFQDEYFDEAICE